jgi:hypothetical protein
VYLYFKSCHCLISKLLYRHRIHIENELVEYVNPVDQEYEEIVEEYDEVLV